MREPALQEMLSSAISVFNRANTDADAFPYVSEITLLRVAFETLLGAGHKTKTIRVELNKHFASELPSLISWTQGKYSESVWRATYTKDVQRPLDAWLQDFCAVRNRGAHGTNNGNVHPVPIWSINNHLLFSSWLFPLIVKKVLSDAGYYQLSELDKECRASFEDFFAYDILTQDAKGQFYWSVVDDKLRLRELGRELSSILKAEGGKK